MGLLGFLKLKKKADEKEEEKGEKQDQKQVQVIQEDPMVTMTREVMNMRYFMEDMKRAMHDDHHRILDEFTYLPRREDINEAFKEKIEKLKAEQLRIAKEIEVTEFQKGILEVLSVPKSAQDVATELGRSRTWISQQISTLNKAGFLEKEQKGKSIKYRAIGSNSPSPASPVPEEPNPNPDSPMPEDSAPNLEDTDSPNS